MNTITKLLLLIIITALSSTPAVSAPDNSVISLASAQQLLKNGKHDTALEQFLLLSDDFATRNMPAEQAEAHLYAGQAYLQSGKYLQADMQLTKSAELARKINSRILLAKSLNLMGTLFVGTFFNQQDVKTSYTGTGAKRGARSHHVAEKDNGLEYLTEALTVARELSDPRLVSSVLNNQGNLFAGRNNFIDAKKKFLEALSVLHEPDPVFRASVLANLASLFENTGEYDEAEKYAVQAYDHSSSEPFSFEKMNVLLKTGNVLSRVARNLPGRSKEAGESAHRAFRGALICADNLKDEKARGFALGYDGTVHEKSGDLSQAFDLTRKALFSAQLTGSKEQLALWQWQLARLHAASGNENASLAAYRRALSEFQQVKQSAPSGCSECLLSFKEFMEPVYKGLLEQMFNRIEKQGTAVTQQALAEIRDTIELFRTAELQDFFKDACVTTRQNRNTASSTQTGTALVYYTILPKRLEIIAQLPSGFKRYTVAIDTRVLAKDISLFRSILSNNFGNPVGIAKRLYDIMLLPLQNDLASEKIETLVIVPDGILRSIPVSALHDGREYVVSKYAVTVTQGLNLTDTSAVATDFRGILMAGISEGVFDFPPLPSVTSELAGIAGLFEGKTLLNSDFRIDALRSSIEKAPYSIIHLATHGEFTGDINSMYILAYDGTLRFDQLDRFIRVTKYKENPLELLTLSACKTASGDDRAVLGLAGIAVKAGAKSTMAALWEIDDQATSEFIVEFYRQLKIAGMPKAKALKNAQMSLMKLYPHPYYWAPFLMVGNWK